MIHCILCNNNTVQQGGEALLGLWQTPPESWIWVDLQDEDEKSEQHLLVDRLQLNGHAAIAAQRPRHPPGSTPSLITCICS